MSDSAILLPLVAQIGWTFLLYVWLTGLRVDAVRRGEVRYGAFVLGREEPLRIARVTRNLANQFELPVIFYAVIILLVVLDGVHSIDVAAAWMFFLGRVAHTLVQTLTDDVPLRGQVFTVNFLAVVVLAGHLAWLVLADLLGIEAMRDGGRIQAAIEILADVEARHRPVVDVLKEWGLAHRFAGSGDRVAIGNLVHDALRRRASLAWIAGDDSPRAIILAAYGRLWRGDLARAAADPHGPAPLSEAERERLATASLDGAPPHVAADVPEWLWPSFVDAFGDAAVAEGQGLASRAPIDLRVNTLKTNRDKVFRELSHLTPEPTPLSPVGLRLTAGDGAARPPAVTAEPAYKRGLVEIQDEGSQVAALVAAATPGEQVVDLCAGAGGKTLALAAAMAGKGQIYAFDADKRRFGDIFERLQRAGVRNAQVRHPEKADPLGDLVGRADLVLVDAPCSGQGTWRRRPEAKWRLTPQSLALRLAEQDRVLAAAAPLVKAGGRLVYVTCSLLPEENEARITAFRQAHPDFAVVDPLAALAESEEREAAAALRAFLREGDSGPQLRLTPAGAGTDGFTVQVLRRTMSGAGGG